PALQDVLELAVTVLFEPRRREVRRRCVFAELGAGEIAILLRPAEQVARRVAFAAVAERLREIRAAVNDRALRGVGPEFSRREEQPLPAPEREAPAIQHSQIVRLARLRGGLERSQVSPEIAQVRVADSRERGGWQRG